MRMSKSRLENPLTAGSLLQDNGLSEALKKDEAFQVLSKIRSSSAFWKKEQSNLMAMIRQQGTPALFVTLSVAETKWPELLVDISEEDACNLPHEEKARILKNTWKPPHGSFGNFSIKDYYYRIEFQHRGSPHAHMMLWLEGAPSINFETTDPVVKEANRRDVCAFVDTVMTSNAHHPDFDDNFKELVVSRQHHHHTKTCFKKNKKIQSCRFAIPIFPMDETIVLDPLPNRNNSDYARWGKQVRKYLEDNYDTLGSSDLTFNQFINIFDLGKSDYIMAVRSTLKMSKIFLKRELKHACVNQFNSKILRMHRANIDIQYI
ncbi:hypothetical protein A0J61_08134, partial [Choanephora cucurbitarum]